MNYKNISISILIISTFIILSYFIIINTSMDDGKYDYCFIEYDYGTYYLKGHRKNKVNIRLGRFREYNETLELANELKCLPDR